jgi:mycothiol synthase
MTAHGPAGVGDPAPPPREYEILTRVGHLAAGTIAEALAMFGVADDTDGVYPVSERVLLRLREAPGPEAVHVLASSGGQLVGYGFLDGFPGPSGVTGELVVHPSWRRRGIGSAIVATAVALVDRNSGPLLLWAHGDHPSATAVALSFGFERWRVLWQLRRSLRAELPEPRFPEDVRLRSFRPGEDDPAWLDLNAAAFADHPEQGAWRLADLRARMAESWFSPSGFLLAERAGGHGPVPQLIGFNWTKVRSDSSGEVYVLGVSPTANAAGLGTALTLAGLRHLRDLGLDTATLYVDESNHRAVGLYRKLGFAHWSTDVCFRRASEVPRHLVGKPGTIGS